jgi:transcriptional regulator with GAF, ATPase, and Fis domain
VIAREIHDRSPRVDGPFLRVNCGAIPPELIDSELFGHEKGSFTGAVGRRRGWFERADGGTLLLDECGELPAAVQVRLLRVLQEGEFERVGSEETVRVDVRIIAATHRDLAAMVRDGQFRQDLWYRLAVFPVEIPPLRSRLEDLPEMVAEFACAAARRFGLTPRMPTIDDLARIIAYPWPGNVRELKAVIDRAVILGNGRSLEVAAALGGQPGPESAPSVRAAHPLPVAGGRSIGRVLTLDEATREHIERVLMLVRGRIEGRDGAGQLLGVNPHTLRGKMRRLGIDWNRFRGPDGPFADFGEGI